MHAHLSKKVGMPNQTPLTTLSWNGTTSHLSVGGDHGALRVLLLASTPSEGTFTMNQGLPGHGDAPLSLIRWNEPASKVTTASEGLIIVWSLHAGEWYEQMVNERKDAAVADFRWSPSGNLIAIAYTDGMVIVGQVSGERVWGIQFEASLTHIAWSPSGRLLLLGTSDSPHVLLHDAISGAYLTRVPLGIPGLAGDNDNDKNTEPTGRLTHLEWYASPLRSIPSHFPSLALVYDSGHIQLMTSEIDDSPLVLDTHLTSITSAEWAKDGSVFAVAGTRVVGERSLHLVQFYSPMGSLLHTLKVPGSGINDISWSGDSLRLALAVGASIFFASIRPPRVWTSFGNIVSYTYMLADDEVALMFWNTKTTQKVTKYLRSVGALVSPGSNGSHLGVLTQTDAPELQDVLIVFDSIGNPLASQYPDLTPSALAMSSSHLVAVSPRAVYVWHYAATLRNGSGPPPESSSPDPEQALFHIDTDPQTTSSSVMELADTEETDDPITAVAVSASTLLVARASGTLLRFSLPRLARSKSYATSLRIKSMSLNADDSVVAILDLAGALHLYSLTDSGILPGFEKKSNVSAVTWGDDDPGLLAALEKDKLYVYRGATPEEAIPAPGMYLLSFSNLVVQTLAVDDMFQAPEFPSRSLLQTLESRSLRDTRAIIDSVNLKEAMGFVADNPHPRLWQLLGEAALEALDLGLARAAFIKCHNYEGLTFLKRLRDLRDPLKQSAEVAAHFGRFDEAEALYMEMNRADLAIGLRVKVGDWFRVVKLLSETGAGDDKLRARAHCELGDYYADRAQDARALVHYQEAHAYPQVAATAYRLGDFDVLADLVSRLPDRDPLLTLLGSHMASVGMADEASAAYVKAGNPKAAVDVCVSLQRWDTALRLAESVSYPGIQNLLSNYADKLLAEPGGNVKAIELYRQAGRHADAGALLLDLAASLSPITSPAKVKALYVLAGMCHASDVASKSRGSRSNKPASPSTSASSWSPDAKLTSLMSPPRGDESMGGIGTSSGSGSGSGKRSQVDLSSAWRGAQAIHLFLLAQSQLYQGDLDAAMTTALRISSSSSLQGFLPTHELASLVALTSYSNRYFKQASLAFIKLEGLPGSTGRAYGDLAVEIFKRNPPRDRRARPGKCGSCSASVAPWDDGCSSCDRMFEPCVVTGSSILDREAWRCGVCGSAASQAPPGAGLCPICEMS